MDTQRVHHPSTPEPKPLATFPLDPLELQRWVRFAVKGGIGKAVAKVDKASEDGVRDLMFLEGDMVTVLMDLGRGSYLGYCEGVVGLFSGAEVVMQQAKLKRPVISTRSASAFRANPHPPVTPEIGAASPALPPLPTASLPEIPPPAPSAPKPTVARDSIDSTSSSNSLTSPRKQRRKPVPALEAGLGIAVGVSSLSRVAPPPRTLRLSEHEQEVLTSTESPRLAAALVPASSPVLPRTATFPLHRPAAASPSLSSDSDGTNRTPSLVASPYSDLADRDRDFDDSASSTSGHGYAAARQVTPFTPEATGGAVWAGSATAGKADACAYLDAYGTPGKDYTDGPTPTAESFPLDAFPLPSGSNPLFDGLPYDAPTPSSSPTIPLSAEDLRPSPSHVLSTSGMPLPVPSADLQSAFSFSPNSPITSTLPASVLSAGGSYARHDKSSDGSSGGSVPGTPGDDPTLAFIFDSYRYSRVTSMVSLAGVAGGAGQAAIAAVGLTGRNSQEVEELAGDFVCEIEEREVEPALRTFGAATQLRSRMLGRQPAVADPATALRPAHTKAESFSSSVNEFDIPRMSEIFPRSPTADSPAPSSVCSSRSGSLTLPYDSSLARPTQGLPGRPPVSPRRQSELQLRRSGVPVLDDAGLRNDLDASRRLFQTYFTTPSKLVDAAAAITGTAPHVPPSPSSLESPQRRRRKSVKGLQISQPVVPALRTRNLPTSPPLWRSHDDASPVEQVMPHETTDVFVASPVSMAPPPRVQVLQATSSAARTYIAPRQRDFSVDSENSQYILGPVPSSSAASSPNTFTSAASSPVPPSIDDGNERASSSRADTTPKKLRKGVHRTKSSPAIGRHSNSSTASLASPVMPTGQPKMPAMPTRQMSDPFGTASSPASPVSSSERKVDYSTGISNRDFEEETIAIGKSEFEVVKPLAALLTKDDEDPVSASASFDSPRPSMSSSLVSDFTTPRRPLPPPHSVTALYPPVSAAATPYMSAPHARSTVSLSHFSPPTPASVEDGGRAALDDYRAKEAKWLQVLSMTLAQARKSKKVKGLTQGGIPSSVRGKAWAFLADAQAVLAPGLYQSLSQPSFPLPPAIEEDMQEVLDHPQFGEGSAGREDLVSILRATLRYDRQLGYYRGLANVVALLLSQMPAETAFGTLISLVKNYSFRHHFPTGVEQLRLDVLAFDSLFETEEPKVAKRLNELGVSARDYLPVWLPTFFLTVLPHTTVVRLMDLLLFDPKMRYRIPLALLDLSHLDDRLAFPSRDAVLNHLLAPPPTAFEPALLFPAIAHVKLSDDKLKKAQKKAARAMLLPQQQRQVG